MSRSRERHPSTLHAFAPDERLRLARLAAFAEQPKNHYRPPADWRPEETPAHVRAIGSYRVIYCIWIDEGGLPLRHLTITWHGPVSPNAWDALTIASLCGFTGGAHIPDPHGGDGEITTHQGSDWQVETNNVGRIFVIAQRLPARSGKVRGDRR